MREQIASWYKKLNPDLRLAIFFAYWSITYPFVMLFFNRLTGNVQSINEYIFMAFGMGGIFTFMFKWSLIKEVFRKKINNNEKH